MRIKKNQENVWGHYKPKPNQKIFESLNFMETRCTSLQPRQYDGMSETHSNNGATDKTVKFWTIQYETFAFDCHKEKCSTTTKLDELQSTELYGTFHKATLQSLSGFNAVVKLQVFLNSSNISAVNRNDNENLVYSVFCIL